MGVFFDYIDLVCQHPKDPRPKPIACLGCQLTTYLEAEADHLKLRERDLVGYWLTDQGSIKFSNKNDTYLALSDPKREAAISYAANLEIHRQARREPSNYDDYRIEPEINQSRSPKTTDPKVHSSTPVPPVGIFSWGD